MAPARRLRFGQSRLFRSEMKISRFACENVHGYLSFQLAFNPDLTFLTGINGSGKTTAVRAITALLTPSLRDLANIGYSDIAVEVEHEGPRRRRAHPED